MPTGRTLPLPPPGGDDPIDGLIAECLARLSQGEADPFAEICQRHPAHAEELRRRHAGLAALGLVGRSDSQPHDRIGSFQLLRELGRGGMGVVWLAHQERPLRRLAAVKVIGGRASLHMLARFESERQALAMLVHPNIAQVLEAGSTGEGQPWYAMEFVDGLPLTAYCERHRLLIEDRLQLFLQLGDAVQFAHQQGVLHRDLKPGNVLVCERGGRPLVKVIDFGLAKMLQEPFAEARDLTEAGQILGTPEYMSPEQAMPSASGVDTRTDIYALGTILYELCTGMLPFDFAELRRRGFQALQRVVCEEEAPAPSVRLARTRTTALVAATAASAATTVSQLVRRLRGDLDWIVGKALAKDRDRRYGTVAELAADVRRHLRNEPVLAGPPSARYVLGKFARRHRAGVAVSLTVLVGLVAALVVTLDLLGQRDRSLAQFDSLQVALDLAHLEESAVRLWPARPERLPALAEWLDEARDLLAREPMLRAQMAQIEQSATRPGGEFQFASPREEFLRGQLSTILRSYGPEGPLRKRMADVEARRQWAATLRQRTIDDCADAWRRAIDTIADVAQCPDYQGLRIVPQLGFVPLARDDHSKLYEFAFLQPGENLPERDDHGWVVREETSMVFVLIPGGEARLGIDWPDERLPPELAKPHDTEYLPRDDGDGGRSFTVRLRPFLLSKYEMSRAQWVRATGVPQPSNSVEKERRHGVTEVHPVGAVSALDAETMVFRLGLALPTSAQWQYAARARAASPWWTGFELSEWRGRENLSDASFAEDGGASSEFGVGDTDYDDHFVLTAPVNSLAANPFGLHHVLGNVRELSRDGGYKYGAAAPTDGDGTMVPTPGSSADREHCDVLGGSYSTPWLKARSTLRTRVPKTQAAATFGVRPCMALADT